MRRWIIGAIPVSAWVSWAAWRGPPPPKVHSMPAQLQRTASPQEREQVRETARRLSAAIQHASKRRGHSIDTIQLESHDAKGTPYVDELIPDNPLMPNIASVAEHCPPERQRTTADWVYCPTTGVILPVVDGQSLNGKE